MQKYTEFTELPIIYRGDDEATMKPYGGMAVFRDGRFVLASRYRGRLAMVGADGMVISSCDPLSGHIGYDKLLCYGIALHTNERYLYMLAGEEGSNELYVLTIEVIPPSVVDHSDPVFRWVPVSDVRLPSVPARDGKYTEYPLLGMYSYPELHGQITGKDSGEATDVCIPWDIEKREPLGGIPDGFLPESGKWVWTPVSIDDWVSNNWVDVKTLDNPCLGPILIDYPTCKPCMTGIGSRVLISCMHAQLFYINKELVIPYQKIEGGILGEVEEGELRQKFLEWLINEAVAAGVITAPADIEEDINSEIPQAIGPQSEVNWRDVFREGSDGVWWVDEEAQVIHFRLSYQDARPITSFVTIHPDLGTVDGIFNLTFNYPVTHMYSELGDVTFFLKDIIQDIKFNAFEMPGASVFFTKGEFVEDYTSNPNPTPIDMDFYLRLIKGWLPTYKQYKESINPMSFVSDYIYKSQMTWEDALFDRYVTEDEALLSVHAPMFSEEETVDELFRHAVRSGTSCGVSFINQAMSPALSGYLETGKLDSGIEVHRPCRYPFSLLITNLITNAAINHKNGALTVATEDHVMTAKLVSHRLVTTYNDRQIGDGLDIYVGKVLSGTPKVVDVTLYNEDVALAQLRDIKVEIVASDLYPYYALADLSLNGTTWSKSITYSAKQLLSTVSGAATSLCSFSFQARVSVTATLEDPKPIRLKTTYTRVLS